MSGHDRQDIDELLVGLSTLDEHAGSAGAAGAPDRTRRVLAGVSRMRARRRVAARWAAGGVASVLVGMVIAAGVWRSNRAARPADGLTPEAVAAQHGAAGQTAGQTASQMASETTSDAASMTGDGAENVSVPPHHAIDPRALAGANDTEPANAFAPGRIARPFALIELELVRHRLDELKTRRPVIH